MGQQVIGKRDKTKGQQDPNQKQKNGRFIQAISFVETKRSGA